MPHKDLLQKRIYEKQRLEKIRIEQPERWAEYVERRRAQSRAHKARNREKAHAAFQRWYWEHGGKEKTAERRNGKPETLKYAREKDLRRFGITLEQYYGMLETQGWACAICRKDDPNRGLAVDHCHTTHRVRGLLCNKCNRAIGLFNDDVERMTMAIDYLRKAQA